MHVDDALIGEAELHISELADIVHQVLDLFELGGVFVGEVLVADVFDEQLEVFLFEDGLRSW